MLKKDVITYKDVFEQALKKWGYMAQLLMVIEECGELQQAILKLLRHRTDLTEVIAEMADVRLMLAQLQYILGITDGKIDSILIGKIQRLKNRLDGKDDSFSNIVLKDTHE